MKTRKSERDRNPYLILNRVFVVILFSVMLYSALYSPEKQRHPIPSGTRLFFGRSSPASGLSRSFSAIVRLDFKQAERYNPNGIRVFLFFFIQLFMRIGGMMLAVRLPEKSLTGLYWADSLVSISLLLISFRPFLEGMVKGAFGHGLITF